MLSEQENQKFVIKNRVFYILLYFFVNKKHHSIDVFAFIKIQGENLKILPQGSKKHHWGALSLTPTGYGTVVNLIRVKF